LTASECSADSQLQAAITPACRNHGNVDGSVEHSVWRLDQECCESVGVEVFSFGAALPGEWGSTDATYVSCWTKASQAMADHPDFAKRDLSSVRGGTMLEALPPERRSSEPELTPNLLGMTETGGPHTMVQVPDTPLLPERRGSFGIFVCSPTAVVRKPAS
jgi:hypothetical protein